MRYAWFGLACVFAAFLVFHLTFKVDRKCTFHATGGTHLGVVLVHDFVPDPVPNGNETCGHVVAFR